MVWPPLQNSQLSAFAFRTYRPLGSLRLSGEPIHRRAAPLEIRGAAVVEMARRGGTTS
jgi:hypothetical protein